MPLLQREILDFTPPTVWLPSYKAS